MVAPTRRAVLLLGALAALAASSCAPPRTPDVEFDPTPESVVAEMLALAGVTDKDLVYDLGCGDGRIVVAAAKRFGARAVGVDIDPALVRRSRDAAARAGVGDRVTILEQDLFATDFRGATVVALFLSPDLNVRLRPTLWRDLRPGSRVVSYIHDMGDWKPEAVKEVTSSHGKQRILLWRIPPKP